PPLKLVLLEHSGAAGGLNHLGIEVADIDAVDAEQTRLAQAGLASVDERGTTCCYAKQDKFWVQGAPNGESWEVYTVLEDSPTFYGDEAGQTCCGTEKAAAAATELRACCRPWFPRRQRAACRCRGGRDPASPRPRDGPDHYRRANHRWQEPERQRRQAVPHGQV